MGEILRAAKKEHADKDVRSQMKKIGSVKEISHMLVLFSEQIPSEFARKPWSVKYQDRWKATYVTLVHTCKNHAKVSGSRKYYVGILSS